MPIIAKNASGKFEPCPAGVQQAVCCDVVDLGLMDTAFGQKYKVDVRWQTADLMENGQPYLVSKRYTLSLHEKSNLRHDLEAWRGRPFTEAELQGFDLEKLIGVNCQINVMHKQGSKGGTFANVVSIMPLGRGMQQIHVTPDYVRVQDRNDTPEPNEMREEDRQYDEDPVPF